MKAQDVHNYKAEKLVAVSGHCPKQEAARILQLSLLWTCILLIPILLKPIKATLGYITDLFMVHQIHSNVTSDHQPKISNYLNHLVPDWLSLSTICNLVYVNLNNL